MELDGAQFAPENHVPFGVATEGSVRTKRFRVEGVDDFPFENVVQMIGECLPDERVFVVDRRQRHRPRYLA